MLLKKLYKSACYEEKKKGIPESVSFLFDTCNWSKLAQIIQFRKLTFCDAEKSNFFLCFFKMPVQSFLKRKFDNQPRPK